MLTFTTSLSGTVDLIDCQMWVDVKAPTSANEKAKVSLTIEQTIASGLAKKIAAKSALTHCIVEAIDSTLAPFVNIKWAYELTLE